MTLIIAFMVMAHVGASWVWYPAVFIIWMIHALFSWNRS